MTTPSGYDRRRLEEIEAALRASDPGLDRALRTFQPRRAWPLMCLFAGWVMAAVAGLAGWWVATLIMLGPLLALTYLTFESRRRGSTSSAVETGMYPPMWTRFWG